MYILMVLVGCLTIYVFILVEDANHKNCKSENLILLLDIPMFIFR